MRGRLTLANSTYELRLKFRGQLARAEQLRESWRVNVEPSAPIAFPGLIESIRAGEVYASALYRNIVSTSPAALKRALPTYWEHYRQLVGQRERHRKHLDQLVTAYNERVDSKKVFTTAEPYIRMGEQAGLFDGVLRAADRLMASYCGSVRPEYAKGVRLIGGQSQTSWKGVVATTLQREFWCEPRLGILELPESMKSLVQHLLTPLAHEAGHHWMANIRPVSLADSSTRIDDLQFFHLLFRDFTNAFLVAGREDINPLVPTFAEFRAMDQSARIELATELGERTHEGLDIAELPVDFEEPVTDLCEEMYCDLYAWAVAGPAYFLDLARYTYRPMSGHVASSGTHPPDWTRLRLGQILSDKYPADPSPDPWLEGHPRNWDEAIHEEVADRQQCEQGIIDEPTGEYAPLEWIKITSPIRVERMFEAGRFDERLHEFLGSCFQPDATFYPRLDRASATHKYEMSLKAAKQLWFQAAVVDTISPRDLAAISAIQPIIRRPFFPSDKFYHSILLYDPSPVAESPTAALVGTNR